MWHQFRRDNLLDIKTCLNYARVANAVTTFFRLPPPTPASARSSVLFAHRVPIAFWRTSVQIVAVNLCHVRDAPMTNWIATRRQLPGLLKPAVVCRPHESGGETRNQRDELNARPH